MISRLIFFQIFFLSAIGLYGQKPTIGLTMDSGYCSYSKKTNRQNRTLNRSYSTIINTGIFVNYEMKNYLFLESVFGLSRLRRKYGLTDRIYNISAPEIDLGEFIIYRDYTANSIFLNFNIGFKWQRFKIKLGSQFGLVFFFQENESKAIRNIFITETSTLSNYTFKNHFLQTYGELYSELNYSLLKNLDLKLSISFNKSSNRIDVFEPRSKFVIGLNSYFRND